MDIPLLWAPTGTHQYRSTCVVYTYNSVVSYQYFHEAVFSCTVSNNSQLVATAPRCL